MAGIAALFAVALLAVLVPAVVFADAPGKPTGGSATSGNGTMTLRWDYLSGATGGYDFRYSDSVVGMIGAGWLDVPGADNANDTTVTLPSEVDGVEQHKLTAGTLYYFQVRGKDDRNNAGPASELFNETQRASPTKLTGVTAIAGNAEVTLSWDAPPAGDFVFSYGYRQDGGSGWGGWQNFSSVENNYTVTGLSNGTTYSFQVRAKNSQGSGTADETATATPSGPRLRRTCERSPETVKYGCTGPVSATPPSPSSSTGHAYRRERPTPGTLTGRIFPAVPPRPKNTRSAA